MDSPLVEYQFLASGKNKEKLSKKLISYSPETPSFKNSSVHISSKSNDDPQRDMAESEETPRAYRTPSSVADSSKSRSEKMHAMPVSSILLPFLSFYYNIVIHPTQSYQY